MKRSVTLLPPLVLALLAASPAHGAGGPNYNAAQDPAAPAVAQRAPRRASRALAIPASIASVDARRGVPSFLWAARHGAPPALIGGGPEQAARAHLARLAHLYALPPSALAAAVVKQIHDTGRGGVIVTLGQDVDGVEVFHERMKILMRRDDTLVAASGHLHTAAAPRWKGARAFALPAEQAIALALDDLHGGGFSPGSLVEVDRREGGYRRFDLVPGSAGKMGAYRFSRPARAKKVFFPMPDRLVPGYYVELFSAGGQRGSSGVHGYVIAADDGRLLYRADLTAAESYSYRVWADTAGDGRPLDGPIADFTPHPTGTPDGSAPPFIPPALISMDGFNTNPDGGSDPWLPAGAMQTKGNNVDAYTDDDSPDGFSGGDVRAGTTGPNAFDRVFDPLAAPDATVDQRMAAVTQLFYTTNWLHDYWYDSGFDEAAGNAQQNNHGRGGVSGDPLLAQAQDGALIGKLDNANMATPEDGESPRMQMLLWSGMDTRSLEVQPLGSLASGVAEFGPGDFDVTGEVVLVQDGAAPLTDACEAIVNDVSGKIALLDRGGCTFAAKLQKAQAAGAIGVILANHTAGEPPPPMPGNQDPSLTIPILSVTLEDGDALKAALQSGSVTAHLARDIGPRLDGSLDNLVVAHEWGHYLHHRLVLCSLNQCGGQSEGWGDFLSLTLMMREGDDLGGTYSDSVYAPLASPNAAYFGTRRHPYSIDFSKNALTFRHIQNGEPLPAGVPSAPNNYLNAEVHNTGEVWASMLFDGYVALLGQSRGGAPRYSFDEARRRMADYVVAGMKLAPIEPTFTEQRDAILAAAFAADEQDMMLLAAGFAGRGAGSCARSPDRASSDNVGVVESFDVKPVIVIASVSIDDSVKTCDADGILDAEETGLVTIELMNGGIAPLAGVDVEVTAAATGVELANGGKVTVGPIAPFGTTKVTLEISVDRAVKAPGPLGLQVKATSAEACEPEVTAAEPVRINYDNAPAAGATDDFESDLDVWQPGGDVSDGVWAKEVDAAQNHTWHGVDLDRSSDTWLESPAFHASPTEPLVLSFRHRHSFETGPASAGGPDVFWDGGVLEISTDGGKSWDDLSTIVDPGYGGTIGNLAGNPLSDRPGFVSVNASWPEMEKVTIDVGTALADMVVKIRFRMGSDQAAGGFGWEIDDIGIEGAVDKPFPALVNDAGACNKPPVADAGEGTTVRAGEEFALDGSGSSDPEGDALTFAWKQVAGPKAELGTPSSDVTSAVAPEVEQRATLTFQVTVSDGFSAATDTVDIVVEPTSDRKPVGGGGCGCGVAGDPRVAGLAPLAAGLLLLRRRSGRRAGGARSRSRR